MLFSFLHCNYCSCDKTSENLEEPLLNPYFDSNNIRDIRNIRNIRDIRDIDIAQLMNCEPSFLINKLSS